MNVAQRRYATAFAVEAAAVGLLVVVQLDPLRISGTVLLMLGVITAPIGAFACVLMLLLAALVRDVAAFRTALAIGAAGGVAATLTFIALLLWIDRDAPRFMFAIAFFAGWACAIPFAWIHVTSVFSRDENARYAHARDIRSPRTPAA